MYNKPDFVKVDLEIKDNFAAYTHCDEDWEYRQRWTGSGCREDEYQYFYTQRETAAWQCYTTSNP